MPTTRQYTFDIDTKRYLNRVNTYRSLSGLNPISNGDAVDIDNFVIGLKDLGLWHNSVIWMMRNLYNVGAGTVVLSFGGSSNNNYDGTMATGASWGLNGISFDPLVATAAVNYSPSIIEIVRNDHSCISVVNKHGQDNACIFESRAGGATGYYSSFSSNDNTLSQLFIASITRNSVIYFSSNRGGTVPTGFTFVGGTVTLTSQSGYKNGALIATESNLGIRNAIGSPSLNRTGNGNIRVGTFTVPFVVIFNTPLSTAQHASLYLLAKATIGKTLGLP
jgi:hypothetical protein